MIRGVNFIATIKITEKNFYKYIPGYYLGDEEDMEDFDDDYAVVKGTSGADNITVNLPGQNVNDYSDDQGYDVAIKAGAGNDKIIINGYVFAGINAGKGNDTLIQGTNDAYLRLEYANGDGNDVVSLRGSSNFSLDLSSGKISNYKISGKDHILTIGSGSV